MSRFTLILILILTGALAASVAVNVWQYQTAQAEPDGAAWDMARDEIEARTAYELHTLESRHQAELTTLIGDLAAEVAKREAQIARLTADLDAARSMTLAKAAQSDGDLQAAIAQAAELPPDQITVYPDEVGLTHPAALHWTDLTLSLKTRVALCEPTCRRRLAEQQLAVVPPLVEERQDCGLAQAACQGKARLATAEARRYEALYKSCRGDLLAVGLASGFGGLALGGGLGVGITKWAD